MASYLWVRIRKPADTETLEGFVASRFGWRLYEHFFKTQSEKVWGVPCSEIQADWGAQRIKDLSLWRAVREALVPRRVRARRSRAQQVTSLIEEFNYPKYGPGMMWERCAEQVTARGASLTMEAPVTRIDLAGRAIRTTDPNTGTSGLFPELVFFDCHACHHPMSDLRWNPRPSRTIWRSATCPMMPVWWLA